MPTDQDKVTRKLKAILSADVKGYSILMADDEVATINTLKLYRGIMSNFIERHGGRVVDAVGDNLLAEFESAVDAVQCAVEVQKELKAKNQELPAEKRLEFRIGVNIGDVIQDGDRIFGDGVNIAARIEGLSVAGGVCVSRNAYDHIKKKLKLGYEYLGEHSVKNISEPVRVYRVLMEEEDVGRLIDVEKIPANKKWFRLTATTIAIILFVVIWQFYYKQPAPVLSDNPSIAVLPFENMSGDPEQEYFSDGMTDELIGDLAKIKDIFVISRNSAFTYKGKSVKIQQIAEELNVRYILEGSVQKSGDKVRIRAQLIDGKTDHHLWSESYDALMDDIFELQDNITGKIVSALAIKLTSSEKERISDKGTDNILAYNAFLKGQEHLARLTGANIMKAIDYYKEAVQIDPNFSRAYAQLASCYNLIISNTFLRQLKISSLIEIVTLKYKARHYLELAMKNPTYDAYRTAAYFSLFRRNYDEAVSFAETVLSIAPNESVNNLAMGSILSWMGRADEALLYIDKAIQLDPLLLDIKLGEMGLAYFVMGNYEKAVEFTQRCLTLNPGLNVYASYAAASYAFLNQQKEAEQAWNIFKDGFPEGIIPSTKFLYWGFPFKNHKVFDRYIEGLIKAGFKGEPSDYFMVIEKNKLNGQEIRKLLFGKKQTGIIFGFPWSNFRSKDGKLESPDIFGGIDKGKSWIEGDEICNQFENLYEGVKYCNDIYYNPKGNAIDKSQYLSFSDALLLPFSIED